MKKHLYLLIFYLMSGPVHSQEFLKLYCNGFWSAENIEQSFVIEVESTSGFMWGYDAMAAIGLFDIGNSDSKPSGGWGPNKGIKCSANEVRFFCSGSNRVGMSKLELSRLTGKLKSSTLLKNEKQFINGSYQCDLKNTKKF
jgi:hypothetical protein